ncbi:hypothetical protein QG37_07479 [Candidozyma auris]|uniref:Uncharacterized protein n=1 Tax=Candidozyma auris TaxID=498019 RepID=A0A0L0NQA8_CANAR|nr:hypothetical protein QG37_07479 [[Candida] auris]
MLHNKIRMPDPRRARAESTERDVRGKIKLLMQIDSEKQVASAVHGWPQCSEGRKFD